MTPSLGTQVVHLARRSIARTLRQPAVVVPNLLFPIILLAILSAGGDKATDIKGFPTDSYITFILGATLAAVSTALTAHDLLYLVRRAQNTRLCLAQFSAHWVQPCSVQPLPPPKKPASNTPSSPHSSSIREACPIPAWFATR